MFDRGRSNVSPRSKPTSPPPPAASFQLGPTAHCLPISPPSTSARKPLIEATPGNPIIKWSRPDKARTGSCDANPSPPLHVAPMRSLLLPTCPAITGIIPVEAIPQISRISQIHIGDSRRRARIPTNRRSGHDKLLENNSLRQKNENEIILYINILTHAIIHATLGSITTTRAVWVFPAAK